MVFVAFLIFSIKNYPSQKKYSKTT